MSVTVKDATGSVVTLKATDSGGEQVIHHIIDSVGGNVTVLQGTSPWVVSLTGGLVPGTSATSLGKAEDATHASGDTGVMVLAVRHDAGGALAGTTGDYAPLQVDATGSLRVTGVSGSQYAEDTAHTTGDSGTMALAVRRDADTVIVSNDGDYSPLLTDSAGRLKVAATLAAGTNGIGKLTANAGVVIGAVEQSGVFRVARDVERCFADVGGTPTALTVKTAVVQGAAFPMQVVAAVASKKIRVLALSISSNANNAFTVQNGSGGTAIYIGRAVANSTVVVCPGNGFVCETSAGTALFVTGSASTMDCWVAYVEV